MLRSPAKRMIPEYLSMCPMGNTSDAPDISKYSLFHRAMLFGHHFPCLDDAYSEIQFQMSPFNLDGGNRALVMRF